MDTNHPRILVAYYSFSGNTHLIAEAIAQELGADLLRVRPEREPPQWLPLRLLVGGFQTIRRRTPDLHPLDRDPSTYDLVFIGTPVWVGSIAPAIRSFLASIDLDTKPVALFCSCGDKPDKTFSQIREKLDGGEVLGSKAFVQPLKELEKSAAEASAWAREIVLQVAH